MILPETADEEQLKWLTDSKTKNSNLASLLHDVDNKYLFVCNPPQSKNQKAEENNVQYREVTLAKVRSVLTHHHADRFFFEDLRKAQAEYDIEQNTLLQEIEKEKDEEKRKALESQRNELERKYNKKIEAAIIERERIGKEKGLFVHAGRFMDSAFEMSVKKIWGWLFE